MIDYCFHEEAVADLDNAVAYYESREPGLGLEFADEIQATIEHILCFPTAWPVIADDIRRCQTRRFPYGVLYSLEGDLIYILAVMHLHRSPDYYAHRKE